MRMNSHNNQNNEQNRGFDPTTTIIFDDSIIEILHNPNVTKYPYVMRLSGYISERFETRMSRVELRGLAEFILKYLENN